MCVVYGSSNQLPPSEPTNQVVVIANTDLNFASTKTHSGLQKRLLAYRALTLTCNDYQRHLVYIN